MGENDSKTEANLSHESPSKAFSILDAATPKADNEDTDIAEGAIDQDIVAVAKHEEWVPNSVPQSALDALEVGSRLLVYYFNPRNPDEKYWYAKLRKQGANKKGQFLVHFDGQKSTTSALVKGSDIVKILGRSSK